MSISHPPVRTEEKAFVSYSCVLAKGEILFLASFHFKCVCVDKCDKKVCARLFIHKAIYFYFAEKSFLPETMQRWFYEPARCIIQKFSAWPRCTRGDMAHITGSVSSARKNLLLGAIN